MKTSILAVGTELLFGQTVNTNATFLSDKLNHMGFDVMYHFVVGDNPARLKQKLVEAFVDTDLGWYLLKEFEICDGYFSSNDICDGEECIKHIEKFMKERLET